MFCWEVTERRSEDYKFEDRRPLILGELLRNGFLVATEYLVGSYLWETVYDGKMGYFAVFELFY